MKQSGANRRVNEQARHVIAEILMFEISDPALTMLTITGCEVSYDRSVCNVFFTCMPQDYDHVQHQLNKAAGKIRSLMARKLSWRTTPQLRFFIDSSVDESERISHALENERLHFQDSQRSESEDISDKANSTDSEDVNLEPDVVRCLSKKEFSDQ